jgi:predicted TIM-barrel fold metal-dependent hydrolase
MTIAAQGGGRIIPTWYGTSQIMFGSDLPLVSITDTARGLAPLGFDAADFQKIARDNAIGLIPRLKT